MPFKQRVSQALPGMPHAPAPVRQLGPRLKNGYTQQGFPVCGPASQFVNLKIAITKVTREWVRPCRSCYPPLGSMFQGLSRHLMKNFAFAIAVGLTTLAPLVQAQTSMTRPLTAPANRDVARTAQDKNLGGDMSVNISVAPLTSGTTGYGLTKLSTRVLGAPFGAMPSIGVDNPTTQDAALKASKEWVAANITKFKDDYGKWMREKGISMGFFTYNQEIMVTIEGGTKKKAISFNATIDINGRPTYGDPKIVDPEPTIVEATYIPLKTLDDLPSHWKYPDAGKIRWRVLNRKFEPLTPWRTEDTGGAYDMNTSSEEAAKMAACFIDNKYPNCAGPVDVRALMDRSGSTLALATYVRSLEPVYEGSDTQTPKAAISIDQRTWDCTDYKNKGSFGFVLTLQADQYIVEHAAGPLPHQLVQQFGGEGVSPTEPYEKSVPISALGGRHPSDLIINPLPEKEDILSVSDPLISKHLIYVAPVTAIGGDGLIGNPGHDSDMAVRVISGNEASKDYYIGTVGDNYWPSDIYDRTVTFEVTDPSTTEQFHIVEAGFDDHFLVAVNNTIVYVGADGGSMIEVAGPGGTKQGNCSRTGSDWVCLSGGAENTMSRRFTNCVTDTGAGSLGYLCNTACDPWYVQTRPGASGRSAPGCLPLERGTSWQFPLSIDLRPYLKSGTNEIFMRTIVGGEGEGWIKVRTATCGANLGLSRNFVPVPPYAGEPGVTKKVRLLAKQTTE